MSGNSRDTALGQLKAMQAEITAIRYYNKKLSSIKKDIEETTVDPSGYETGKAERLKRERTIAMKEYKAPVARHNILDVVLFVPFAVISLILMIMLYPGEKVNLLGGVVNWILQGYFILYPLARVAGVVIPSLRKVFTEGAKSVRLTLIVLYGLSAVAVIFAAIFRPVFLISVLPLVLGVVALILKGKEDKRSADLSAEDDLIRLRSKYAKLIREAEVSDAAEAERYEADLAKCRNEKKAASAEVIKECSAALLKHKAKFKEVKVIPDYLMQKDMGVVDSLIAIITKGQADTIDEAIEVYNAALEAEKAEGEIRVYVGIRRRDGWAPLRNLVYLDGERVCSAEMPYSVIKATAGEHFVKAKVQLNYGGSSHYPESEEIKITVKPEETVFVKFFVKGTPTVGVTVCETEDEFNYLP